MKNLLISTLVLIQMLGCKSNEQIPQQETRNIDALYQQFHGKYRIVNAVSNEEVDVNLDGKASTDLLLEKAAEKFNHTSVIKFDSELGLANKAEYFITADDREDC